MRSVLYSSPFVAPEWIAACGLEPVRLLPTGGGAAEVLQGVCPFAADFACSASLEAGAAAIVFASTCDQMRRMAEVLGRRGRTPVFLMNVPATWRGPAPAELYLAELRRLGRFLAGLGGRLPTRDTLADRMRQYEAARRDGQAQGLQGAQTDNRVRLALLGAPLRRQDYWIHDLLQALGARVVLDATETGHRCLPAAFDPERLEADPERELVRAYFETIPDAFRRPDTHLYDYLRRELAACRAEGLVLVRYLWCDQWHAQRERLKEFTELPLVEIDLADGDVLQRTRTRLETLVSILR